MKTRARWILLFVIAALAALSTSCATFGVRAWQRDILARADMQPDHNAIDRALDDHIYFSKEASSGGHGFGGGGCGCN
jgi:hypothetical protein